MRTLITTWCVIFLLYVTSTAVQAGPIPFGNQTVWTGNNVVGNLCVEIRNKQNNSPAVAELWLINQNDVQWFKAVKGHKCLDVKLSETSILQAISYDETTEVNVIKDDTSTFFVVELPI